MQRFLVFPLVLGVVAALFPWLALEGLIPWLPILLTPGMSMSPTFEELGCIFAKASAIGVGFGALLGLLVAAFDLFRRGRNWRGGRPLAANIAWCLLYAHAIIALDLLLVFLWLQSSSGMSARIEAAGFSVWIPPLLCLIAIVWGTVRSLCTDDVLSPRILGAKLKRSVHIEG